MDTIAFGDAHVDCQNHLLLTLRDGREKALIKLAHSMIKNRAFDLRDELASRR